MADTVAYYSGLLATIDSKLSGLIANPEVDYGIGPTAVKASQKFEQLCKIRDMILKRMQEKPAESIETLQTDFSAFGEDLNEYVNEDAG